MENAHHPEQINPPHIEISTDARLLIGTWLEQQIGDDLTTVDNILDNLTIPQAITMRSGKNGIKRIINLFKLPEPLILQTESGLYKFTPEQRTQPPVDSLPIEQLPLEAMVDQQQAEALAFTFMDVFNNELSKIMGWAELLSENQALAHSMNSLIRTSETIGKNLRPIMTNPAGGIALTRNEEGIVALNHLPK